MRNRLLSIGFLTLGLGLAGLFVGCQSEPQPQDGALTCSEGDELNGQCMGVPEQPLCDGDTCTEGVACAEVAAAHDDASLDSAIAAAGDGTCIALSPGTYGAVDLPGGVSLLGRAAADVTVKGVSVAAGNEAIVRGVQLGDGGVHLAAGAKVRLDAVRLSGAAASGVDLATGAIATISRSTIAAGSKDGVLVGEGASVTLEDSIVEDNAGPGIRSVCSAECGCPTPPEIVVRRTIVRSNHVGGVLLFGAQALLESVKIEGTLVGDDVAYGAGGGGLKIEACSNVNAKDLDVSLNASYGILVDDSDAYLGDPASEPGITVTGNKIGVWAQNVSKSHPQTVTFDGLKAQGNRGVGLGTAGDTVGLIICRSVIAHTSAAKIFVKAGGSKMVGDGLLWLDTSQIAIDGLALVDNELASVVIDGEANGSLTNVTQSGGDDAKGIVQQSYSGGAQPAIGANAPAITTSADALFDIPLAPELPPESF